MVANVGAQWDSLNNMVNNYYSGVTFDFSSSSDEAVLDYLANPTNFAGCTSGNFQSDSWIPTIQYQTHTPCQVSGGNADNTNCSHSVYITSATNGCTGCMDSQLILEVANVNADLPMRYSGHADCTTWVSEMT